MMKVILTVLVAATLTGCAGKANFTATGVVKAAPRPADCDVTVYTVAPKADFVELGVIEYESGLAAGPRPDSIAKAKKIAAKAVCQAGGNGLLVWEANGLGYYLKATVVKVDSVL